MQLSGEFSSLISFPWLHLFLEELPFFYHVFLHLVYLWMWCLIISLLLILAFLLVVNEALCDTIIDITILVGQLNKYLVVSSIPLISFKESAVWSSKYVLFL